MSNKTQPHEFEYQLLSRLKADCEYYLNWGGRSVNRLWAGNVEAQIAKIKELWNVLETKPRWLTMEQINEYERQMTVTEENKS